MNKLKHSAQLRLPFAVVASALALMASVAPTLAMADPGYYFVSLYDVPGQTSIDFKYWNAHYRGQKAAAPDIGIGYGVTSRWYTELYGTWEKEDSGPDRFEEIAWQNDYMLTQGQFDIDVALHTKIERPQDRSEGYALEWGPVMKTDIGRVQLNANVFFQRNFRVRAPDGDNHTELAYQLQMKYRSKSAIQPGIQAYGEVGQWDHWLPSNQQSHRAGPALFGSRYFGKHELEYEAAYLIGRNEARAAKTFSMRAQYIF
jgi:hypothetical protein